MKSFKMFLEGLIRRIDTKDISVGQIVKELSKIEKIKFGLYCLLDCYNAHPEKSQSVRDVIITVKALLKKDTKYNFIDLARNCHGQGMVGLAAYHLCMAVFNSVDREISDHILDVLHYSMMSFSSDLFRSKKYYQYRNYALSLITNLDKPLKNPEEIKGLLGDYKKSKYDPRFLNVGLDSLQDQGAISDEERKEFESPRGIYDFLKRHTL